MSLELSKREKQKRLWNVIQKRAQVLRQLRIQTLALLTRCMTEGKICIPLWGVLFCKMGTVIPAS